MVVKTKQFLLISVVTPKSIVVKTKQFWLISVVSQKSMVVKTKQFLVDFGGYSKKYSR